MAERRDIQRDSSTRKRPLITDDADDTERKGPNQLLDWTTHVGRRQRQKFIDLSDVPPKLPILSNRKGTSKYQGVYFDKKHKMEGDNRLIERKKHHIGTYDDTKEEAAVDYARAKFKYKYKQVLEAQQQILATNSSQSHFIV